MAAWGGAFRATRAAWKKRKGPMLMPGLLEAQLLAVARQPERVLRNRGLVEIGQVCLPNALQQSIKAIVAEESIRLSRLPFPQRLPQFRNPAPPPVLLPPRNASATPGATSSAHVHRDVRRLMSAYDAFFSGWPQPSAERLADDTREPPLMREMDVGRIPDARMVRLLRGWEKNSWGKGAEEGGEGDAREAAERGKGGARDRGEGGRRAVEYGETEALAYAAARMPSTYAAVFRALTEVKRRLPSLAPSSLLDFGSGPGTVMWAASEVWGSTVQRAAAVEPADAMWTMGERIRAGEGSAASASTALPCLALLPAVSNHAPAFPGGPSAFTPDPACATLPSFPSPSRPPYPFYSLSPPLPPPVAAAGPRPPRALPEVERYTTLQHLSRARFPPHPSSPPFPPPPVAAAGPRPPRALPPVERYTTLQHLSRAARGADRVFDVVVAHLSRKARGADRVCDVVVAHLSREARGADRMFDVMVAVSAGGGQGRRWGADCSDWWGEVSCGSGLQYLSREAGRADRVFDVMVALDPALPLPPHSHRPPMRQAYALGEVVSVDERRAIVDRLWSHARHVMVLVETGNPRGYEAIAKARAHILHTQRAGPPSPRRAISPFIPQLILFALPRYGSGPATMCAALVLLLVPHIHPLGRATSLPPCLSPCILYQSLPHVGTPFTIMPFAHPHLATPVAPPLAEGSGARDNGQHGGGEVLLCGAAQGTSTPVSAWGKARLEWVGGARHCDLGESLRGLVMPSSSDLALALPRPSRGSICVSCVTSHPPLFPWLWSGRVVAPLQQIAQFRREEKERQAREEAEKEAKRLAKKQGEEGMGLFAELLNAFEGNCMPSLCKCQGLWCPRRQQGRCPIHQAHRQHTSTMSTRTCLLIAIPDPSFTPLSLSPLRCAPALPPPPAKWGPTVRLIPLDEEPVGAQTGALQQGEGLGAEGAVDPALATDNPPRGDRFANLSPEWSRVIREPRRRGQHVIVDVCASVDGRGRRGELQRLLFSKAAGRVEYRFARKVRWGDLWPSTGEAQEGKGEGENEGSDTSTST
ncbi:unnamed protein product [Closterium sp. Yama58-4]|nr:unnamed protein product [Closterium sp. Yama58-4]